MARSKLDSVGRLATPSRSPVDGWTATRAASSGAARRALLGGQLNTDVEGGAQRTAAPAVALEQGLERRRPRRSASRRGGPGCRPSGARSGPGAPTGRPGRRPRSARPSSLELLGGGRRYRAEQRPGELPGRAPAGRSRRAMVTSGTDDELRPRGPRSPRSRSTIASTNCCGPPPRSWRRIGPASTSSTRASPVAVARGLSTSLDHGADALDRALLHDPPAGAVEDRARARGARGWCRAARCRVSSGWTSVTVQRTFHSSSTLRSGTRTS